MWEIPCTWTFPSVWDEVLDEEPEERRKEKCFKMVS